MFSTIPLCLGIINIDIAMFLKTIHQSVATAIFNGGKTVGSFRFKRLLWSGSKLGVEFCNPEAIAEVFSRIDHKFDLMHPEGFWVLVLGKDGEVP